MNYIHLVKGQHYNSLSELMRLLISLDIDYIPLDDDMDHDGMYFCFKDTVSDADFVKARLAMLESV